MRLISPRWAILAVALVAACGTGAASPAAPTSSPTPATSIGPGPTATALAAVPTTAQASPLAGRILWVIEGPAGNRIEYLDQSGLHEIRTDDPSLAKATWAPAGTILFDSERDGPRHIFRMGADGQSVVALTSGLVLQEERPAISPDGSTIAYAEFEATFILSHGLWVANADGSKPRQLTANGQRDADSADTSPAFSPDGTWIVFERAANLGSGLGGLFLIHPDGTGLRRLTDDSLGAGYPRWSPDAKRILFSQHYDGTFVPGPLWVVDVSSGAVTPVTDPNDPGISTEGDWSPDGSQVVYIYFAPGMDHNELRLVDADGTHMTTLWVPGPADGGGAETPDWGP